MCALNKWPSLAFLLPAGITFILFFGVGFERGEGPMPALAGQDDDRDWDFLDDWKAAQRKCEG